jgi:sugar lactone lactonase YvrE
LSEFVQHYSPSSSAGLDFIQLAIDPIPTDPLDYAVAVCDASNPGNTSSTGAVVSPVAGNGQKSSTVMNGNALGPLGISLNSPTGIAVDSNGNVFFDDDGNNAVLELNANTTNDQITTFAGTGTAGFTGDGGAATNAELSNPTQLTFDAHGNLYISDAGNNRVRMVTPAGVISTVAGDGQATFSGDGPVATKVALNFPDSIAFDSNGNLYIADTGNNRIRMVTPAGAISTVAGNGNGGFNGDGIAATSAELNEPTRVAVDSSGNLYIADVANNRVREVNGTTHIITTIAGTGTAGTSPDGTSAVHAEINQPVSIALDSQGNLFISDIGDDLVRAVNTQASATTLLGVQIPSGAIATVIGGGTQADTAVHPALNVSLAFPTGLITDSNGYLYVADADNNVILRAK